MANMVGNTQKTLAEKKAILDRAADSINEKAKKIVCGRIGRTPEIKEKLTIKWIPTPSYKINKATGGGIPVGKFSIVTGEPDSGKTSILLETIAFNMKKNPDFMAAWLESENSLNIDYIVETFGIDPERFFFIEHEKEGAAETAIDILAAIAKSGTMDIIVINSLKCLVPKIELDNDMEDHTIALQARLNSKMVKKFTAIIQECDTAFVAVTHKTTDIGGNKYIPLTISGGRAIKYASLLTIDMNRLSVQKDDPIEKEDGMKIKVSVMKNHCCCSSYPYVSAEYYVRYGEGIMWDLELLESGIDKGILKSAGAWVSELDSEGNVALNPETQEPYKWNGKKAFMSYLRNNEDYKKHLEALIDGEFTVEALNEEAVNNIMKEEERDRVAAENIEDFIEQSKEKGIKGKKSKK